MSGDPILVLTAGSQAREAMRQSIANLEEWLAVLQRHSAELEPLEGAGIGNDPTLAAMRAEVDAGFSRVRDEGMKVLEAWQQSLAMDEEVYQRFPHLRPEHTPDE